MWCVNALSLYYLLSSPSNQKRQWKRTNYKVEGRVLILGEWISKTECRRAIVIGPDWPCVIIAYFVIVIPSVFVYLYLLKYLAEKILFWVLLSSTLLGLTVVFLGGKNIVWLKLYIFMLPVNRHVHSIYVWT